jgi:hypothetical protein
MPKRYHGTEHLERRMVELFICPVCGFGFDSIHTKDDEEGGWVCLRCEALENLREYGRGVRVGMRTAFTAVSWWINDNKPLSVIKELVEERLEDLEGKEEPLREAMAWSALKYARVYKQLAKKGKQWQR